MVIGWPSNAWTGEGWPDLLVWLSPHLFGLEVKQGRAHATPRQLARLLYLRKHGVHAWIVRTPQEAITVIQGALNGTMTFNDNLLAELDAALMGGPVEAAPAEPEAPVEVEELPVFDASPNGATTDVLEAVEEAAPEAPAFVAQTEQTTVEFLLARMVDAAEAIVLELRMLNTNVKRLGEEPDADAEPVMTVEAPAARRRPKSGRVQLNEENQAKYRSSESTSRP